MIPPRSQAQWAELVRGWFPELTNTRLRRATWPAIEAQRDYIATQLTEGVTAATIHQRLRGEQGLDVSKYMSRIRCSSRLGADPGAIPGSRRAQAQAMSRFDTTRWTGY